MLILNLIYFFASLREIYGANRTRYVSTERPEVTWFNPKYFRYVNMTAQRYSRTDPFYYLGYHVDIIWPIQNNVSIDLFFYDLVTNQYRRSSLELHFELCETLVKELFFGISLGMFFPYRCPLQPGVYHVENVTVPLKNVPEFVPFSKGRVEANFTSKDTNELLGLGHIDVEIKQVRSRNTKNRT